MRAPQFWAEDGSVFFVQARTLGAEALITPSAGYLHTVLRLVAWAGAHIDPSVTPAFYSVMALALTLYVAARTQSERFPFKPSIAYALAVALVPDAFEVLLNLTNVQWILAGGLMLVLISREPTRGSQRVHDIAATALLGLTGPFVVALGPLFAWRAWVRRTRFSVGLALLALGCAVVQVAIIVRSGHEMTRAPIAWDLLVGIPGLRVGSSLLTAGAIGTPGALVAAIIGAATIAGVLALGFFRGDSRHERQMLAVAFIALLGIALFRCRFVLPALYLGAGARYFFPLQLIALWLLIAGSVIAQRWRAGVLVGCCALFVMTNIRRWREPAMIDYNWPYYAAKIRAGEAVRARTNPEWEFEITPQRPSAEPLPASPATLVNISARCYVTAERPAVVGFTVKNGPRRRFLIRAIGPSLAQFGVQQPLAVPNLRLLLGSRDVDAFKPEYRATQNATLAEAARVCRAFELDRAATHDAAGLVELGPGVYTVLVSAAAATEGEALVEVYAIPSASEQVN